MRCASTEYSLISFLEDRPASPFPSRELDGVRLILATDGPKCSGSYRSSGPVGLLLRTLVDSSIWRSTLYSLTWKRKTTKQGRSYCRLSPSVRPIVEIGASWWRTPEASDYANRAFAVNSRGEPKLSAQVKMDAWATPTAADRQGTTGGGQARSLRDDVRAWPTPSVHGNNNQKGLTVKSGDGLATAVKAWSTPKASEATRGACPGEMHRNTPCLTAEVRMTAWATPAAQDAKNATLPPSQARRDTLPGDLIRSGSAGQLNPDWVECLMGYPIGWTRR